MKIICCFAALIAAGSYDVSQGTPIENPVFTRGYVPQDLADRMAWCDEALNCGGMLYWRPKVQSLYDELRFQSVGYYDDEDTEKYIVTTFHALPPDEVMETLFVDGNGKYLGSSNSTKHKNCKGGDCHQEADDTNKGLLSGARSLWNSATKNDANVGGEAVYYISKKKWLIQRGVVSLPYWHGHPALLKIQPEQTIEEARDWCLKTEACVAFFFPIESSGDLKKNDFVVYVSDIPAGFNVGPGQTQVPRIFIKPEDYQKGMLGEASIQKCEFITHVLHNRLRKRLDTFDPERLRRFDTSQLSHFWKVMDDIIFPQVNSKTGEEGLLQEYRLAHQPYRPCCEPWRQKRIPMMDEIYALEEVDRIPCNISRQEFYDKYESKRRPVVLEGCAEKWSGQKAWDNIETFQESTGGNETQWEACSFVYHPMSMYKELVAHHSTFCAFDPIDTPEKEELISPHYQVPPAFDNADFFAPLGKEFPTVHNPMKWFSWGTVRSSSQGHYDEHLPSTDAWNTLVRGQKWWILFPDSPLVKAGESPCDLHCSTLTSHREKFMDWQFTYAIHAHKYYFENNKRPLHIVQRAGDTIYIPDGWMHSLYNQGECVAVTHSYGSPANLPNLWKQLLIHGKPQHWRKMYYTHMDAAQRQQVRETVQEDQVCVIQTEMKLGSWKICDDSDFARTIQAAKKK